MFTVSESKTSFFYKKMATTYHCLVFGYIRAYESSLSGKIVPKEIFMLCYKYYFHHSALILLTTGITGYIIDYQYNSSQKPYMFQGAKTPKSHCIKLHGNGSISKPYYDQYQREISSVCAYSNLPLPKLILKQGKLTAKQRHNYVLFKCGGHYSPNCTALIFNANLTGIIDHYYLEICNKYILLIYNIHRE